MQLEVLAIGTKVKFGEHRATEGEIFAILIERNAVQYEIVYWEGHERHKIWLYDYELDQEPDSQKVTIRLN